MFLSGSQVDVYFLFIRHFVKEFLLVYSFFDSTGISHDFEIKNSPLSIGRRCKYVTYGCSKSSQKKTVEHHSKFFRLKTFFSRFWIILI